MHSLLRVFTTVTALSSLVLASSDVEKRAHKKATSTHCFTSLHDAPVAAVRATTSTSTPPCTSPTTVTTTVVKSVKGGTATALIISTTTAPFSTQVVPVPSGFQPIDDTLKGAGYDGSAGPVPPQKRSLHNRAIHIPGIEKAHYVAAVSCNEIVAASACTSTVTSTSLSTTGAATTTTTYTTETFYASTTTVYPACASNNVANTYKGKIVGSLSGSFAQGVNYTITTTDTAFDCCKAVVSSLSNTYLYAFVENATYAAMEGGNCAGYYAPKKCRNQRQTKLKVVPGDQGFGEFTFGQLDCAIINGASTVSSAGSSAATAAVAN